VLTGGGELLAPGHVWRNRSLNHPYYTLGELDGQVTPRLAELVELLSDAGKTKTTTNLLGSKWTKLVHNAMGSALSALAASESGSSSTPRIFAALHRLGTRSDAGGRDARLHDGAPLRDARRSLAGLHGRRGGRADPRCEQRGERRVDQHGPAGIARGRPSEVTGFLNGLVVRKGVEAGVPTPINRSITEVFPRLEIGEISPDVANLGLVAAA
jgi:2-dehydropantoate 2-reductase